jgi:hypothetical protein
MYYGFAFWKNHRGRCGLVVVRHNRNWAGKVVKINKLPFKGPRCTYWFSKAVFHPKVVHFFRLFPVHCPSCSGRGTSRIFPHAGLFNNKHSYIQQLTCSVQAYSTKCYIQLSTFCTFSVVQFLFETFRRLDSAFLFRQKA